MLQVEEIQKNEKYLPFKIVFFMIFHVPRCNRIMGNNISTYIYASMCGALIMVGFGSLIIISQYMALLSCPI